MIIGCVYFKNTRHLWEKKEDLASILEKKLDYSYRIDVQTLNNAPPSFSFQVLNKGRHLSDVNRKNRMAWEAHRVSAYQDIKPMLDFYDKRFLSR